MLMRWKRWLALTICVTGVLIWGGCQSSFSFANPLASRSLQVHTDRLVADLQALAHERYTEADRAEVRTYLSRQLVRAGYE
ncbi:MAG: hypothetical protein AAFZ80_12215, partial [Cyanobacteria bacterium P01_A01_bin.105]